MFILRRGECVLCFRGKATTESYIKRLYCSSKCQKQDWATQKPNCGKTERIELASYYPLLAIIQEQCHAHQAVGIHPALEREVVNDVNPGTHPYRLPNGYESKVVLLGDKKPMEFLHASSTNWWPLAQSPKVASKLQRRVGRGGNVLPIITAVCIAMLSEIYTTTSGPDTKAHPAQHPKRVRFKYRSSPIADFGIATGYADVKKQDRLAFWTLEDGIIRIDQDPREHYWIYFTTLRGETLYLDCGLFTFNMCIMVGTQPYVSSDLHDLFPWAPAFFRDTNMRHNAPPIEHERKRFSVLRNESLHQAVMHSTTGFDDEDCDIFSKFMEQVAGRKPTEKENLLLGTFAIVAGVEIRKNLRLGRWKTFPVEPAIAIETDPGESIDWDAEKQAEDWDTHMKEWKKKLSKQRKKEKEYANKPRA